VTGTSFGYSVSLDKDRLLVGGYSEQSASTGIDGNQSDTSAVNAGAAYLYTRTGTTWSQSHYLKATNTQAYDAFGYSVAISADTLAISAVYEDGGGTGFDPASNEAVMNAGAVYLLSR
jgi:hypothetical protein